MWGRVIGSIQAYRHNGVRLADRRRQIDPGSGHCTGEGIGPRVEGDESMTTTYAPFDAADYLDNGTVVVEYLTAAIEDPNPDVFLAALGDVARARGMAQIAADSGLGRESLYKALSVGAHPRYETVNSVLRALGVRLSVVAGGRE
jgi:probable addiction module antidote protein